MAYQKPAKWVASVEDAMQNATSQSPRWRGFVVEDLTVVCGIVLSLPLDYARTHVAEADIKTSKKKKMKRVYCCVALGSGTRCVGAGSCTSAIQTSEMTDAQRVEEAFRMHDGHAEVMARRAFVAFLLQHATMLMEEGRTSDGLLRLRSYDVSGDGDDDVNGEGVRRMDGFELQPEVQLHLVSTRWMCGGMALAMTGETGGRRLLRSPMASLPGHEVMNETPTTTATQDWVELLGHRISAHVPATKDAAGVDGGASSSITQQQQQQQDVCACCVKPGKGPPNLSMSCSDKVWRWANFGVQGRRRSLCFTTPMYMESLHVAIPEDATTDVIDINALVRLFHNKNRALRPDTRAHAPPAPLFSAFFVDLIHPSYSDGEEVEIDERDDSNNSRSAWVQAFRPPPPKDRVDDDEDGSSPRKRTRGASPPPPPPSSTTTPSSMFSFRWTPPTSLVLNTKFGLPQGMTVATLHNHLRKIVQRCNTTSKEGSENVRVDDDASRACIHAVEKMLPVCASMTDPFPLSRAWMAARVLKLVHLIHESGRPTLLQTWAEEMKVKADVSSVSCFMESWMPWVDGLWATAPRVERLPLTNNNNNNNNVDGDVPRFPPRLGGRMPFHVMNEAGALVGTKDEAEVLPLVWVEKSATMS